MYTKYITITITGKTHEMLTNIKGNLLWSDCVSLLILCMSKRKFEKSIKGKIHARDLSGQKTIKLPLDKIYQQLIKLKGDNNISISIILQALIENVNMNKFEQYKKIKLL